MKLYCALILVAFLQISGTQNNVPVIGKLFWPPSINLLEELTGGATAYSQQTINECLSEQSLSESPSDIEYYENNELFYRSIGINLGFDLNLLSVDSIQATLASISDVNFRFVEVEGTQLDYGQYIKNYQLIKSCLADKPFDERFLNELMSLPILNDTDSFLSYIDYEQFSKLFGAFVVTRVTVGARVQVFATARQSLQYSQIQFGSRVCAEISVAGDVPVEIGPCVRFTSSQITESESLDIDVRSYVRGGNRTLQAQLSTEGIIPTVLQRFIASAPANPYPVDYQLTPIWDIYIGSDEEITARLRNLRSYFVSISKPSSSGFNTAKCAVNLTVGIGMLIAMIMLI